MADLGSSKVYGNLTVSRNLSILGIATGDGSGLTGTATLRATGTTAADVGLGMIGPGAGAASLKTASATADGNDAIAFGVDTYAMASASFAEGYGAYADGPYSHAEGQDTYTSGQSAHAEGFSTSAEGNFSHAEGNYTGSIGIASHAEGKYSQAEGDFSHAGGLNTVAQGEAQYTIGKFNIGDITSALIIGNGSAHLSRSNALTVDWSGNIISSGNITDGMGNILSNKSNIGHTHTASQITDFDTEVTNNTSVAANTAKRSYPSADETKLAGIDAGANNYTHPATHPPSIIAEDINNRFVTDAQINDWDSKEDGFSKNTAFNKNFGTTVGTVAQGNDSRIANGQTAYGWGDHSAAGYITGYTVTQGDVTAHQAALSIAWGQLTSVPTYDNYGSWNLKTGGVQRTTVISGGDLDIVGGTNVSVAYGAGGVVTISSTDTNTVYTHPTYTTRTVGADTGPLTGATVISDIDMNLSSDASGHVTSAGMAVSTRTLTLADLGYTGETNATADQTITAGTNLNGGGTGNVTLNVDASPSFTNVYVDSAIYHTGDTDTYTQFHALNSWRVVTGGTEQFEITSGLAWVRGTLRADSNVISYYSDERLKNIEGVIDSPVEKVKQLSGFYYTENEVAKSFGYNNKRRQVGVSAQELEKILPEAVHLASFDMDIDEDGNEYSKSGENYKTVQYEKIVPLLIEAIKEQQKEIDTLKSKIY